MDVRACAQSPSIAAGLMFRALAALPYLVNTYLPRLSSSGALPHPACIDPGKVRSWPPPAALAP